MMNSVTLTRGTLWTLGSATAVCGTIIGLTVGEAPGWAALLSCSVALVGLTCVLAVRVIVGAAVDECLDGFALMLDLRNRSPQPPEAKVHSIAPQRNMPDSSSPRSL